MVAVEQGQQAPDLVLDEAEAPGLLAGAVDGERLAHLCLDEEVRHHPAVAGPEPGTVGVEDAGDADLDPMRPVVGHGHGLGEALGLVVDPPGADRVDVAPIALRLGMDLRVPVDLAGRGQQIAGALLLGQAQGVVGAEAAHLESLDGHLQVVPGRGWAGEVEHGVDRARHPHVRTDVVASEGEVLVGEEMLDVGHAARGQVVDGDDLVAPSEQSIAKVRPEEPGAAGDHHAAARHHSRPRPT